MRTLAEVRARIDAIDEEIRRLLMERLDCSRDAAIAKAAEGQSSTLQSSREREMLERTNCLLRGYYRLLRKSAGARYPGV